MANKNLSLEETVADLRGLSARVAENADLLPDVTAEKSELDKALRLFDDARKRQKIHSAGKRKATQDMRTALGRAKDAARQVRIGAQFRLGARNAKLALFNVAPLRSDAPARSQSSRSGRQGSQGQSQNGQVSATGAGTGEGAFPSSASPSRV